MNIMSITSMVFLLMSMLMLIMFSLKKKSNPSYQKMTSFECGLNQKSSSLIPFSIQFFLIAILFLIFDLEIILFMPIIMIENTSHSMIMCSVIMIILTMGYVKEWKMGMIEWTK